MEELRAWAKEICEKLQIIINILSGFGQPTKPHHTADLRATPQFILGKPGFVTGYFFYNAAATARFVKFVDSDVQNIAVGSTPIHQMLPLPPYSGANLRIDPVKFSNGILMYATVNAADSDATDPTAGDVTGTVWYR